jgi:hypothetical protein
VRHYRPNGRTSAASNFHIKASCVQTRRMAVRTGDLLHAISISVICTSGPWWLSSGCLDLNYDTYLMDERVWTGIHVVRTIATIFPYLILERKSEAWSRPDVCKLEHFEDSRHRGRSGRESTSSGRMMHWTAGRSNGMTRRPDGWRGTEFFDLQIV